MQERAVAAQPAKRPLPSNLWHFLRDCVLTFDENATAKGLSNPVQRWPRKRHLRWLASILATRSHVSVIKSGQIMVTWLVAAAVVHRILTRRGYNVAWYCRTATQAAEHIERRLLRIIRNIPTDYAVPTVGLANGVLEVFHDGGTIPTSRVQPMAAERHGRDSAASSARSETWSLTVRDESAFDPNDEEIHFSGLSRTAEVWRVSTPDGPNFHARLMYVEGFGPFEGSDDPPADARRVGREMWRWQRNGFECVMVLHRADPYRDEERTAAGKAWYQRFRPLHDDRKWAREQRGSTRVPAGEPVYTGVGAALFVRQAYDPLLTVARGHDWGWNGTACVWAQLADKGGGRYCLHFLKEKIVAKSEALDIASYGQQVLADTEYYFPGAGKVLDFGDISGEQHSGQTGKTTFDLLRPLGIQVRAQKFFLPPSIGLFQWLIRQGWLEVDPAGCPRLRRALEGGYARDEYGEPIKDGVHDHVADAARYLANNLFVMASGPGGVETVKTADPWRGYFRLAGHSTAVRGTEPAKGDSRYARRTPVTSGHAGSGIIR